MNEGVRALLRSSENYLESGKENKPFRSHHHETPNNIFGIAKLVWFFCCLVFS